MTATPGLRAKVHLVQLSWSSNTVLFYKEATARRPERIERERLWKKEREREKVREREKEREREGKGGGGGGGKNHTVFYTVHV